MLSLYVWNEKIDSVSPASKLTKRSVTARWLSENATNDSFYSDHLPNLLPRVKAIPTVQEFNSVHKPSEVNNYRELPTFRGPFHVNFRHFLMWSTREKQVYSCIFWSHKIAWCCSSYFLYIINLFYFICCLLGALSRKQTALRNITHGGRGLLGSRGQFTLGSCQELFRPLKKQTNKNNIQRAKQKRTMSSLQKRLQQQKGKLTMFLGNMMCYLW